MISRKKIVVNQLTKFQVATAIAVLFHTIGLVGLLYFDKTFFLAATPFNLLLSFVLLIWTQKEKNIYFLLFFISCFIIGVLVEVIGINTGILFGDYKYGDTLGYKIWNVPVLIGINWFIIIYCCGISVYTLLMKMIVRVAADSGKTPAAMKALSVIIDGATLAVFFDWLMEPVAIKLGYWSWNVDGSIPVLNYICWFIVSVLLLSIFHFTKFNKQNKFAVNLLLIQLMFFLLLRTFLK
ncbi:MAG TPA: carotenoid biosynthesis protein [Ferruginibacter sp.]|nr:carotenoid biosynthesis protein [Ferruginibacter sp.]